MKGTATATPAAVIYANLIVTILEVSLFIRLPELYLNDVANFLLNNCFRFLDDFIYNLNTLLDIKPVRNLFNDLGPDIRFIFDAQVIY